MVILGDSNMQPTNQILKTCLEDKNFINLVKSNTCSKSTLRSCIYLVLTNKPKSFQNIEVMKIGFSDHHVPIFTLFGTSFTKVSRNKQQYRNLKRFETDLFLTLKTYQ